MQRTKVERLEELTHQARLALDAADFAVIDRDGAEARSKLADASNLIDDAMGLIDELMAPEPGPYDDPHLP